VETSRVIKSISSPLGIYIVADGMGGHAAGEVASSTIVNSFAELSFRDLLQTSLKSDEPVNYSNWLKEAVQTANKNVLDIRKSTGSDLGSTFVGALIENNNAYIAHVGDSRAYLITSNNIQQLTTDHSLVERLVATGQITAEEARYHPQRNVIYRTIGDKANIEVDMNTLSLKEGDILILCSDGLSGMVTDEDMLRIIKNAPSPQAACDRLIDAANAAGGEDNITVVIVELRSM
jgi:serine/threonine protein phosphatase PrpC